VRSVLTWLVSFRGCLYAIATTWYGIAQMAGSLVVDRRARAAFNFERGGRFLGGL
jgi:hypothetical protein